MEAVAAHVRDIDGLTVLSLSEERTAYRLASGKAMVFAVVADDNDGAGRRYPLMTLEIGDVVFGTAGLDDPFVSLVVVGLVRSALEPITPDALARDPAALGAALETWIVRLSRAVSEILPPEPGTPRPLPTGDTVGSLTAGESVCGPHHDLVWMEGDVAALLFGVADIEAGTGFPLSEPMRVSVLNDADVRLTTTAGLIADGRWTVALNAYHACIFEAFSTSLALAIADAFNRARARSDDDDESVTAALGRAAAVLGDEHTAAPGGGPADPIARAVALVAQHLGLAAAPQPSPPGAAQRSDLERLERAADAAGLALRRVGLERGFWRRRGLPMIALRDGGDPVVMLPSGRTEMVAIVPGAGRPTPIERDEIAAMDGPVFAIYPGLDGSQSAARRLGSLIARHIRSEIAAVAVLGGLSGLLALVPALILAYLINVAVPRGEASIVAEFSILLVAAAVGMSAFEYAKNLGILRAEAIAELIGQPAVVHRVLGLALPFFRSRSAGEITQRTLGVTVARKLLAQGAIVTLLASGFALTSVVAMAVFSPLLTAVALAALALMAALAVPAVRSAYASQRASLAIDGALTETALQIVSSIDKIRVAGAERRAFALWYGQYVERRRTLHRARAGEMVLATLAASAPTATTLLVFAAIALTSPPLTPAGFAGFMAALAGLLVAVSAVGSVVTPVLSAVVAIERLRPILEAAPDREARAQAPGVLGGQIDVNAVSVAAPGQPPILSDVSLRVAPGTFVAIVGASGAGKSTLLKVMLGLRRPSSGSVFYDGRDLANLDAKALRQQFGVVLQDGVLLPGSILDNLLASARVGAADAWQALRLAGLEAEVRAMPMGLHTVVGEGATLSGGQRQRLMLARALIRKPKILFLDEATSALDEATQASVAANIEALNITRIVIAHRLSTIRRADEIHVMEGGRIVEAGAYRDLIDQGGRFSAFAERQRL